jgi:CubicO group peptidase (beta-lactamase class C family)
VNITKFQKCTFRTLIVLFLSSLLAVTTSKGAVASAGPLPQAQNKSSTQENAITVSDLEAFFDNLVNQQLAEYHIAGATVSIVKDGKIELAKGYGFTDVEQKIPVSADETIFRIGSTSKLFTWTAVMQLAEQGKIDLDADVNTYLPDFQIPATFPQPIIMKNLLSHSAGFEERATGTESSGPDEMISLHDYLASYMPDRVRPAGELSTYSNYGAALAGYIVEVVSGVPFEQYVETYTFAPLSMSHSTFRQPLPPNLVDHLAKSYSFSGGFVEGSFEYPNLLPAATMDSTAHDMANFNLAQLQGGSFNNTQILKPRTVAQMQSPLFSNEARLDGFAYGFIEETVNGERVLWHGGDIGNWHSMLAIAADENLGFFISYNSNDGLQAINEFFYDILGAFHPVENTGDPSPAEIASTNPINLTGEYRSTRSVYNHIERVGSFPGKGNIQVIQNPDHTTYIAGQTFYELEPLVYASQEGKTALIFHQDGEHIRLYLNGNPLFAFERLSWYETSQFNTLIFAVSYVLLLTAILAAFFGIIRRQKVVEARSRLPRIARIWAIVLSTVFLLLPIPIVIYIQIYFRSPFPKFMVFVLAIILAVSILVIGIVVFTLLAWIRRYWNIAGRFHYTLVTLAMLGMVWLMYYWRVLGFRY